MRRAIPVVLAAALAAPIGVNVPVGAQEARLDRLVQSRSLEQPMPSARRVPLPSDNPLELLPVFGNVYLVAGGPSNVAVQIGDEGVLLVDAATAAVSDRVLQAVRALSDGPLSYIVNTTSDREHYGGNARLGRSGLNPTVAPRGLAGPGSAPDTDNQGGGGNNPVQLRPTGAIVIAHENLLNRMNVEPTAEPFEMWPSNSFFTEKKTMWFNDEPIEILHVPAAHTDGDVMVFFRRSDVVVAGDVIHTERYPSMDVSRGGSMRGILDALNRIIDITVPRFNQQGGTRVVPGHGRILNEADVVEYRDMMTIIYDRVKSGVAAGQAFDQIMDKSPTLEYDGLYSTPSWTGQMLAQAIFDELRRSPAASSSH
jgi:glyoxylase-like metal-dependent hydrolase (beta-lactamase superfamily II)